MKIAAMNREIARLQLVLENALDVRDQQHNQILHLMELVELATEVAEKKAAERDEARVWARKFYKQVRNLTHDGCDCVEVVWEVYRG
jgi:hypothetical protein